MRVLQRKASDAGARALVPPIVNETLRSGGEPLAAGTRLAMERRFGHSFGDVSPLSPPSMTVTRPDDASERQADALANAVLGGRAAERRAFDFAQVRIHRGEGAAAAARAVQARAFTVGHDIVLGAGAHDDHLLAHELVHVVQQRSGRKALQRELVIEPTPDVDDPAHHMPADAQRDIVRDLVQQMCSGFDVPPASPLHVEPTGEPCGQMENGVAPAHTGCCCLCVLTSPLAARWTIRVSQNESPHTNPAGHVVVINPSGSPVESMHWTESAGAGERMINRPRVITFGHELCGHAALLEIGSHPARAARETSNVHDPTIKIERRIWGEQGLPAGEQRGLAAGGAHRGESVYRVALDRFPLNAHDIAALPAGEQADLAEVKRFSSSGSWFLEIHGHSDRAGSAQARQDVSDRRAAAVRTNLGAAPNAANYTFVRVEGHADRQPIAGASAERLRRVEVILSLFRAGVPSSPPASPVTAVGPGTPARHAANLASGNVCVRHLATEAWR